MAAKMKHKCVLIAGVLSILFHIDHSFQLSEIEYGDIIESSYKYCVVAIPESLVEEKALLALSSVMDLSFRNEQEVSFHKVDFYQINKPNTFYMGSLYHKDLFTIDFTKSFVVFKHLKKDRTCLLAPPITAAPVPEVYSFSDVGDNDLDMIVSFINRHCQTFRKTNGNLTPQGIHKQYILDNLFSVFKTADADDTIKSNQNRDSEPVCKRSSHNNKEHDCSTQVDSEMESMDSNSIIFSKDDKTPKSLPIMRQCERIPLPTSSKFVQEYLTVSKPVVITGATSDWSAFKKWTNQFLIETYGDTKVHIKITPNGEYEGVESVKMWKNKSKLKIPQDVLKKLPFPDLVVVRPATMEIKFSDLIELIKTISSSKSSNISAYLEYSSISYFPKLENNIAEMSFIEGILKLKHTNIWLSDGNTVGKLHFDPFDNFMCQISGEKEFVIYEPHANERLYESHIQEAKLSYNTSSKSFFRENLLESTSMVMSPVDIDKPDLERFPKFAMAKPMSCTIKPGDVLFTPAFWWHEVRSKPNTTEHRNVAVNFWYEPFFLKEFPCPECGLYLNPQYFHLL